MESPKHKIVILLLAAGASKRMGTPKQLLPWHGNTLLNHTINIAEQSKAISIVAILGANFEFIKESITKDGNVNIVQNPDWQSGMGSSIATGMEYLLKSETEFQGILIMLADQPLIDVDYLDKLIALSKQNTSRIIASDYKNRVGVPAVFPKSYVASLSKLNKDFGARRLMQDEHQNIVKVYPEHRIVDIDTMEDFKNLKKMYAS